MTPAAAPGAASANAVALIKKEHRALARLLGAMQSLIARYRDPAAAPNFELFDAMLRYVENVPDRLHHPKEDRVLFPALARHAAEGQALVAALERDHARGAPMLAELRRAFENYRNSGVNALNQLATAVDDFAEFYWHHMRREENELLPLAQAQLSSDDWRRVESAFGDNTDPLFGAQLAADYRRLYEYIAGLAPPALKSYLEDAAPGTG